MFFCRKWKKKKHACYHLAVFNIKFTPNIFRKDYGYFKCSYLSVFEKSMMDIWKVCYYLQQYYYETTTVSLNICVLKTVVLFSSLSSSPKTILSPKEIDCLLSYLFKVNMFKTLFFISIKKINMLIFFCFLLFTLPKSFQ